MCSDVCNDVYSDVCIYIGIIGYCGYGKKGKFAGSTVLDELLQNSFGVSRHPTRTVTKRVLCT